MVNAKFELHITVRMKFTLGLQLSGRTLFSMQLHLRMRDVLVGSVNFGGVRLI